MGNILRSLDIENACQAAARLAIPDDLRNRVSMHSTGSVFFENIRGLPLDPTIRGLTAFTEAIYIRFYGGNNPLVNEPVVVGTTRGLLLQIAKTDSMNSDKFKGAVIAAESVYQQLGLPLNDPLLHLSK